MRSGAAPEAHAAISQEIAMNRRTFLTGAVSGAAGVAALATTGLAEGQAPAAGQAPVGQAGARGGAPGRGRGTPANVSAKKLARIEIMTLNHNNIIKLPWQEATPQRTLDIFELPRFYV